MPLRPALELSTILGLCAIIFTVLGAIAGRIDQHWIGVVVPTAGLAIYARQKLAAPTINNVSVDSSVGTAVVQRLDTIVPVVAANANRIEDIQRRVTDLHETSVLKS